MNGCVDNGNPDSRIRSDARIPSYRQENWNRFQEYPKAVRIAIFSLFLPLSHFQLNKIKTYESYVLLFIILFISVFFISIIVIVAELFI